MDDKPRVDPDRWDGWGDEMEDEEELKTLMRPWERRGKGRGVARRKVSEWEEGRSNLRSPKGSRAKMKPWRRRPSPPEGDLPA